MALMNGIYQPPRYVKSIIDNNNNVPKENNSLKTTAVKQNPYQQYQQNTVNTSSPQELTLMLYNGLVRFLKTAHKGIEEKDMEKASSFIIRSQDIIMEFMSTLDMQYELSNGLFSLYDYMHRRLIEANIRKDKAIVEEITGYAEELRDTWVQAMKLAKQQTVNK